MKERRKALSSSVRRLGQGEEWSIRKIARHLKVSRRSVKKYLENPAAIPARFVGLRLTVKADSSSVTLYYEEREIVRYPRCWRRHQTLGAERFEKELLDQRPTARRSRAQTRLVALLGEVAESYLRGLAETDRALARQITDSPAPPDRAGS